MNSIIISNVYKSFSNKNVLSNISYSFSDDKISCITGKNGSGKTTLIKLLSTLLSPDQGIISYNSIDINSATIDSFRNKLGLSLVSNSFYTNLTIYQNLYFYYSLYKTFPVLSKEFFLNFFEYVNLEPELISSRINTLSAGQLQKVNLIRAISHQPDILLLDEPTIHLDDISKHIFLNYLKNLNKIVIIAENNLDTYKNITDSILTL